MNSISFVLRDGMGWDEHDIVSTISYINIAFKEGTLISPLNDLRYSVSKLCYDK